MMTKELVALRLLAVGLALGLASACSGGGGGSKTATGTLEIVVTGEIPAGAEIAVTGPGDFAVTLSSSQVLSDVRTGSYAVSSQPVDDGDRLFTPAIDVIAPVVVKSETTSVTVTFGAVPIVPSISSISRQSVLEGGNVPDLSFTVSDPVDAPGVLQVTANSADVVLVPNANLQLTGTGATRLLSVTPAASETGIARIYVTVTNSRGRNTTTSFEVAVGDAMVTNLGDAGAGTLREAIATLGSSGIIVFAPGLAGSTLALASEIAITGARDITVAGPGAGELTLSGGNAARHFTLTGSAGLDLSLTLDGLTLANGAPSGSGGSISATGGTGSAALVLRDCVLRDNTAGAGQGGAVRMVSGEMTLEVSGTTFLGNTAAQGGAVYTDNADVTIRSSTFEANTVAAFAAIGGGLLHRVGNTGGSLTIESSTFAGNEANGTSSGAGGAVAIPDVGVFAAELVLLHTTISGNVVTGPTASGAGLLVEKSIAVDLRGSALAANLAGTAADDLNAVAATSSGYNFIGADAQATFVDAVTDLAGTPQAPLDAMLDAIGDNGGLTRTLLPLPGSPLLDAIPVADVAISVDQRGLPRPDTEDGDGDIGSVERHWYE